MNIYFISNHATYVEREAELLDTYINRIGFGDLSHKSAVWMKDSLLNQGAFEIMDVILRITERKIPCYRSGLFPEDLLWKDYEHLFVLGTPSDLMCMVKLILGYDSAWMEQMGKFPDGMVYMISVEKSKNRLLKNDFKLYYDSRMD